MVRGVEVGCCNDITSAPLGRETRFEKDYKVLMIAKFLDDLKGCLSPFLS